jgi:cell division septal protein FtsQ
VTATASLTPPGAGGRVLDFSPRRSGTPPRRKRRSVLVTLLKPFLAALFLVALPSGVVAWVLTAPRFSLRGIEVEARGPRVPQAIVRKALAPLQGRNLVRLSLAEVASAVKSNPWVDSVEIVKELPDALRVKVAERRPVALLMGAGGALVWADSEGRAIAPVSAPAELEEARKAGLLVVSFARRPVEGGVAAALGVAAELGRAQPDWAAKLSRIEVLGEEDFRMYTDALPFPLLVTSGRLGPKVQHLVKLLPELARRYSGIEAVDLRFSRRIVVQPADTPPPPGGTGA